MVIWQKVIFQNAWRKAAYGEQLIKFIQGIFFHVWHIYKRYKMAVVTCFLNDSSVSFLMNCLVEMS